MIRVRFHARGGHGVKTASRILGTAAFLEGLEAQDSPVYGAERRGAPVVAYARVDAQPIRERGAITNPDVIVIGDETLLTDPAAAVLVGEEGASAVLVNTETVLGLAERFAIVAPVFGIDVTNRSLALLGRASALSAGLAGAAARLIGGLSPSSLSDAVATELGEAGLDEETIAANVALALEMYEALPALELLDAGPRPAAPPATEMYQLGWHETRRAAPSILDAGNAEARHTGSWRVERPEIDLDRCTACGLCFVRCPDGAIALDDEGYPVIDYEHCKGCMICLASCPLHAVDAAREVGAW